MSILQTTDLKKYYGAEPNSTKALDGVTLSIEQGEFVDIVGTSGSGKTVGNVLLLGAFQGFKGIVEYAAFSYPIWMMIALAAILFVFCWFIPLLFVNRMVKKQRLKD